MRSKQEIVSRTVDYKLSLSIALSRMVSKYIVDIKGVHDNLQILVMCANDAIASAVLHSFEASMRSYDQLSRN